MFYLFYLSKLVPLQLRTYALYLERKGSHDDDDDDELASVPTTTAVTFTSSSSSSQYGSGFGHFVWMEHVALYTSVLREWI